MINFPPIKPNYRKEIFLDSQLNGTNKQLLFNRGVGFLKLFNDSFNFQLINFW